MQQFNTRVLIRSLAIGSLLFFATETSIAQLSFSPERAALRNIQKHRWEKAEAQLQKALHKNAGNAMAHYLFSRYFFNRDNPSYQLDSAYSYALSASRHLEGASQKQRDKWNRFSLDSAHVITLRQKIDSASFELAKFTNTEKGYILFLTSRPLAAQREEAIDRRNEVAFQSALKINTYSAFLDFLTRYPEAKRVKEARERYDRLLFESMTRDKRLPTFENFLRLHPETPFREEIEQNIFELATLSGSPKDFMSFIERHPTTKQVKRAKAILFHILREQEDPIWPDFFLTDSLRHVNDLETSYLVPFYKSGKYGFMDSHGREIIGSIIDDIQDSYKCGNLTEDVIITGNGVLSRNGTIIYSGSVQELDDLGSGFLKIKNDTCYSIVHKSGFISERCVDDAKILGKRFLAVLKNGSWSIHALSGRKLSENDWDEVSIIGNVMVLKRDSSFHLVTMEKLVQTAEELKSLQLEAYDEVKQIQDHLIWVKAKQNQAILDQQLNDIVPFDTHELSPVFFGIVGKSPSGYSIYNQAGRPASSFQKVIVHEPWLAIEKEYLWYLLDPATYEPLSEGYDSLKFEGPFVMGIKEDTLHIHCKGSKILQFSDAVSTLFIPGKDSTSFLMIDTEGKKTIFNLKGAKLFTGAFDQIQYAGADLFIVSKKEKKGLVDSAGKPILPMEYDAIGSVSNDVISLLKNKEFGLFNVITKKLIKPQYDKNIIPYTDLLNTAYRDGLYAFIGWDNKPDGKFEFEEVQYWNDTTAFVKQNQLWKLYDIQAKAFKETDIQEIKMIKDTPDEKIAIVKRDNSFGVLSNNRGIVIPFTFSDLVNLGSADEPFYFTEKHVEEAAIFVVIYYDENGKMLRREVYEEADDYEKIYCSDN